MTIMTNGNSKYQILLREMFQEVTIKKNAKAIADYYHKNFVLFANGKTMDYDFFLITHEKIYKTPIQYQIRYDDETWVEGNHKVAVRAYIMTKMPNEVAKEIELILIAAYQEDKIIHLWELTYPDWSKMKEFKKFDQN